MTESFSKLELVWQVRKGGKSYTQRNYLDFVVDGQSLSAQMQVGDNIGCLGWLPPEVEQIILDELLTNRLSELNNDRYSIYVCPECADIGCGAITVQIEKSSDSYIWKNFGYENNYDERSRDFESYKHIGPFQFNAAEYPLILAQKPKSQST